MLVFWGMGISQHTHGTDNARCLISLCLLTGNVGNARFTTLIQQIATEVHAAAGDLTTALSMLERAAAGALVDAVWMARCPLLAPLRQEPRFVEVERVLTERARALWR